MLRSLHIDSESLRGTDVYGALGAVVMNAVIFFNKDDKAYDLLRCCEIDNIILVLRGSESRSIDRFK